jgi:hypothetical protein
MAKVLEGTDAWTRIALGGSVQKYGRLCERGIRGYREGKGAKSYPSEQQSG